MAVARSADTGRPIMCMATITLTITVGTVAGVPTRRNTARQSARCAIVRKAMDICRPVCPNAHQHRHLRRVLNSFPNAYISPTIAMLKVDHPHVCLARVIIERLQ